MLSQPPTNNQTAPPTQSSQQQQQQPQQPAYILSATGQTAAPDQILASCLSLQSHLQTLESNARSTLQDWEERRRKEDLAEKRRVAPGWLDGDVKILVPENVDGQKQGDGADVEMGEDRPERHSVGIQGLMDKRESGLDSREGEELDRAFGGMGIQ